MPAPIVDQFRIHRFGDHIAMDSQTSETIYLTPATARALARVLNQFACDCENVSFTDSTLGTTFTERQNA